MGYTTDLLAQIAQILAAANVGTYRESGAYADGETGIVIGVMPSTPVAAVALIPYPLTDDPTLSDSVTGLQVRCRADSRDPRVVMDLADAVFDVLQNHPGDGTLLTAERVTGTPLGEDANGRPEHADSYQLTLHRPSLHRI